MKRMTAWLTSGCILPLYLFATGPGCATKDAVLQNDGWGPLSPRALALGRGQRGQDIIETPIFFIAGRDVGAICDQRRGGGGWYRCRLETDRVRLSSFVCSNIWLTSRLETGAGRTIWDFSAPLSDLRRTSPGMDCGIESYVFTGGKFFFRPEETYYWTVSVRANDPRCFEQHHARWANRDIFRVVLRSGLQLPNEY